MEPVELNPQQREIALAAVRSYGLESLWAVVEQYMNDGWTDVEQIFKQISNDPDYQKEYFRRFPAIEAIQKENQRRAANGQPPMKEPTAMEYVAMERGYEATLQDLPGNWATRENITKWISSGLSVAMVDERISVAQDYINYDVNPEVRRELRDIYGLTDQEMVAYVLSDQANKDRLANEWDKRVRQANVGAAARSFGIGIDDNLRDSIASSSDSTYTYGQTAAAFSNIADQAESYRRLGAISGYRTSTDDLVADEFNLAGGAEARKMKRRLASQERGRFSGSSSIGRGSLARGGLGSQ